MSYNSLDTASKDPGLQNRTVAATVQEAFNNAAVHDSAYASLVRQNAASGLFMIWPVCLNTEAEYEYALNAGMSNPGGNEAVITDAMILSAVQAHWPPDPPAMP
jgi:hypothetical protein